MNHQTPGLWGGGNIHAPISLFFPHRITEEAKVSLKPQLEMVIQHHLSQPCGHPQALADLPSLSCCLHSPLCTRSSSQVQAFVPRPGLSSTCLPPVLHSCPQPCATVLFSPGLSPPHILSIPTGAPGQAQAVGDHFITQAHAVTLRAVLCRAKSWTL